jgi:lipopolysaccharide export system protein LptA
MPTGGDPGDPLVGSGRDLTAKTYDRKTGRLVMEFSAGEYEPTREGTVRVSDAAARFYLGDGRYIALQARRGQVIVSGGAGSARQLASGQGGSPDRGQMSDVEVELYESRDASAPTLVCVVPVISFDNDTFRIATEATEIDGRPVAADEVPVRVRGNDVEFDGRGLTIRWNGLDGRLESLEVPHGERLTIRNADALLGPSRPARRDEAAPATSPANVSDATDRPADATTAPTTRMTRRERLRRQQAMAAATDPAPPVYRAVFDRDVRLFEADAPIGSADQLIVDFHGGGDADAGAAASQRPARRAASEPASTQPIPTDPPSTRSATTAPDGEAALPRSLTIRWAGRLRVEPLPAGVPVPADPRDAIVRLVGSPVTLTRDGAEASSATLTYHSRDDLVLLEPSDAFPTVSLRDGSGATLSTRTLRLNRGTGSAELLGAGRADLPVESGGDPSQPVSAEWTRSCAITFSELGDALAMKSATLDGDVRITHPQVTLSAGQVDLGFTDPQPTAATTRPAQSLRSVRARHGVRGQVADAQGQAGTIEAEELAIDLANPDDGEPYVQTLVARRDVRVADAAQSLAAQSLEATFAPVSPGPATDSTTRPTTRPATLLAGGDVQLRSLDAGGGVTWTGDGDGTRATGDTLAIRTLDGPATVVLSGAPAVLVDGENALRGERIEFEPDTDRARVVGAGELQAVQPADEGSPARPIRVTWSDGIIVDGPSNRADVTGNVVASATDADGSIQSARGGRVALLLSPRPTTAPVEATPNDSAPTTAPSTAPTRGLLAGSQPMGGRTVREVVLEEQVDLSSELLAADGSLLRRMHLLSPRVRVDLERRVLDVPVAGRVLFEDRRPAEAGAADDLVSDLRGATAVQWNDSLVYDESARRVTMVGGVTVAHQPTPDEPAVRLDAARVVADLEPEAAATNATTRPGVSLKRIVADGAVTVVAPRARFTAAEVVLEPQTGRMIARGTPQQPVELFDEQGVSQGGFDSLIYNTRTRQIDSLIRPRGSIRQ